MRAATRPPRPLLLRVAVLFALIWGLAGVSDAAAQSELIVAPGPPGNLNDAIENDVNRPADRVYVLKRGVYYGVTRYIENPDFVLRLKAEEGEGPMPVILPAADNTGSSPGSGYLRFVGDTYIDGIYFLAVTSNGGLGVGIPYRLNGDGMRLVVRNSVFEGGRSRFFEINADDTKLYFYDSHFRNTPRTDIGSTNGRPLDYRTVSADTLVFENTTFANIGGYLVRYDGPQMNYFRFNHNTIHTLLQDPFNGPVSTQTKKYIVTNNLFVNPYARGHAIVPEEEEQRGVLRVDSLDATIALDFGENDRTVIVENNGIMYSPELLAFYQQRTDLGDPLGPRTLIDPPTAGEYIEANAHARASDNESVTVHFTKPPRLDGFIDALGKFRDGDPNISDWFFGEKENGLWPIQQPLPEDYSYAVGDPAYTMAQKGFPLGDLNWFPQQKAAWAAAGGDPVAVESPLGVPGAFRVQGTFPNPSAGLASVRFDLSVPAQVELRLFDVLGRQVLSMPAQIVGAGSGQTLAFDASVLPAGVYLFRLTATDHGAARAQTGTLTIVR